MSEQQVQRSLGSEASEPGKTEDFAAALQRLEAIVERLEGGDLGLEESLAAFEQGVRLTREARDRLDAAELKVKTLLEKDDGQVEEQRFKGGE